MPASPNNVGALATLKTPRGFYTGVPAGVLIRVSDLLASDPNVDPNAQLVLIGAEGGDIRFRDDGTDVTTAVGEFVAQNILLPYSGDLSQLTIVNDSASAAARVNLSFYSYPAG